MNALELADKLDKLEIIYRLPNQLIGNETHEQAALRCNPNLTIKKEAATMLRQQQAEIEALKLAKKVILRYAEADIAKYKEEVEELKKQLALWRLSKSSEEIEQVGTNPTFMGVLDEPVGHLYPEGEGATIYDIKFAWKVTGTTEPIPLYTHPAKTLTDEEIDDFTVRIYNCRTGAEAHEIVLAILRKAQEK